MSVQGKRWKSIKDMGKTGILRTGGGMEIVVDQKSDVLEWKVNSTCEHYGKY